MLTVAAGLLNLYALEGFFTQYHRIRCIPVIQELFHPAGTHPASCIDRTIHEAENICPCLVDPGDIGIMKILGELFNENLIDLFAGIQVIPLIDERDCQFFNSVINIHLSDPP